MRKRIDNYLNKISNVSLDEVDYGYIKRDLICYENRNLNGCIKDVLRVFADLLDTNKEYINLVDDSILISNIKKVEDRGRSVRLGICNKLEYITYNVDSLIKFCNKKKIDFNGKLENYDNIGYLEIDINNLDDAMKVVDYVNSKLSDNIYSVNPLFFSVDNVIVSLSWEYSYVEVLANYLLMFILKMKEININIDYNNFKDFMLSHYLHLDNQVEMYKYLDFNFKKVKLSKLFSNLYECTNLILYLFNGNDLDEFKDYYCKLNRKNSKNNSKYLMFDNTDECKSLFYDLVSCMFDIYGEEYAKDNIIKYRDTGKADYITRKNNLRKKVMASKNFMIFLIEIKLEEEIDSIISEIQVEKKKKILENVCRDIYLSCLEENNKNLSKIQVARSLIRMQYGDYSTITRNNDARKNAVENIKSNEVVKLIKISLGIEYVKKEEELYELYANYIENICIG